MTCRMCSLQDVCDLGKTARPLQILHLSSSLPGPVKPRGIGGMRAHIVSPCHRATYAYQPVQANLTRMQRMFDSAVWPRGRNPQS